MSTLVLTVTMILEISSEHVSSTPAEYDYSDEVLNTYNEPTLATETTDSVMIPVTTTISYKNAPTPSVAEHNNELRSNSHNQPASALSTIALASREPSAANKTQEQYRLVVMGTEIKDGSYIAVVQDDKIDLEGIAVESTQLPSHEPSATTTETIITAEVSEVTSTSEQTIVYPETNSYINKAEEKMTDWQLSVLQYKTQLNLNSITAQLAQLKQIEQELIQLQNSDSNFEAYKEESDDLERKLLASDVKVVRSRAVQKKAINPLEESIVDKFNGVHAFLKSTLQLQISILSQ